MNPTEATSNIVVALINAKFISDPEEVAEAYKTIFEAVRNPLSEN